MYTMENKNSYTTEFVGDRIYKNLILDFLNFSSKRVYLAAKMKHGYSSWLK